MVARSAFVILVAWCAPAHAGGLVITGGSPRAIGRAGVGTVGDDGGGALLVDPAALARRDNARGQIGVAVIDDAIVWQGSGGLTPQALDQAGSSILPAIAVQAAICDWVIGVGAMTSSASQRAFRRPNRIPPDSFMNAFDYRYAGLDGSLRRDSVTAGVARRLGDAIAVGVSVGASRIRLTETRRIWAGVVGRAGDPADDVELAMTAQDTFVPSAVAGVMIAPSDTRVELAASIGWSQAAHVTGDLVANGTASGVSVIGDAARAALNLRQPVTVRTGVRWLGDRWIAELDGDLWLFSAKAQTATWQIQGLRVIDSTGSADIYQLPSRVSSRPHGALRGALDAELIGGFLWATAGYAFTTAGTSTARLSPTFGDLAGHTLALGLEASSGGFTATLGWSRTWSLRTAADHTLLRLDNPFGGGDAQAPGGTFDGSSDMVGIMIDAELATTP